MKNVREMNSVIGTTLGCFYVDLVGAFQRYYKSQGYDLDILFVEEPLKDEAMTIELFKEFVNIDPDNKKVTFRFAIEGDESEEERKALGLGYLTYLLEYVTKNEWHIPLFNEDIVSGALPHVSSSFFYLTMITHMNLAKNSRLNEDNLEYLFSPVYFNDDKLFEKRGHRLYGSVHLMDKTETELVAMLDLSESFSSWVSTLNMVFDEDTANDIAKVMLQYRMIISSYSTEVYDLLVDRRADILNFRPDRVDYAGEVGGCGRIYDYEPTFGFGSKEVLEVQDVYGHVVPRKSYAYTQPFEPTPEDDETDYLVSFSTGIGFSYERYKDGFEADYLADLILSEVWEKGRNLDEQWTIKRGLYNLISFMATNFISANFETD